MKIEICEQLLASWLKHIKGCQSVQTNWTVSPLTLKTFSESDFELPNLLIDEINNHEAYKDASVFKKSTFSQMLLQCEIDVVGIKINNCAIEKVYMIDSAFHENGLNYGDDVSRIAKKLFRAAITAQLVFKDCPCEIIFTSPKCGNTLEEKLLSHMNSINEMISSFDPNIQVKLLFNKDFATQVYQPILENVDNISDDNDMFLRSLKVCKIANEYANRVKRTDTQSPLEDIQFKTTDNTPSSSTTNAFPNFTYVDLDKTKSPHFPNNKTPRGENRDVVFNILHNLIQNGKMTSEVVENLKNTHFCNQNFYLPTFPILVACSSFSRTGFELKRFYKNNPIEIHGIDYYVCSQWRPERISKLKVWYNKMMK